MPFADGVQSSVNKAKNIHFAGENPCESRKDISNAEFLPNVASSRMKAYLKCLQPQDLEAVTVTLPHLSLLVNKKFP